MSMEVEFGKRKIQIIHDSAFVSLPISWIRTHRLQKGDRVSIDLEENGALRISPLNEGGNGK